VIALDPPEPLFLPEPIVQFLMIDGVLLGCSLKGSCKQRGEHAAASREGDGDPERMPGEHAFLIAQMPDDPHRISVCRAGQCDTRRDGLDDL
jgi:hypothetical protein